MNIIDLIIFLLFTGGVVVFGATFFSKRRTADEYTAGGRNIPGWAVGMSIFATYISSISYLGNPGQSYLRDWNGMLFSLSIPIAAFFAAKFFVPFYRRMNSVSAYEFLERRFGVWARIYANVCYLLTQMARIGAIVYLLAVTMKQLFGWDIRTIIVVTTIAITLYSMLGGIKAVIWTEAIQGIILIGGAIACIIAIMIEMPEGPMQIFTIAARDNKFSLGSFGTSLSESTFWVCLVYGIFMNLQNFGIDQNYVQRYITAKSDRQARFSALFGGYLYIPISAMLYFIGTALYAYVQASPELPISEGIKSDDIFPWFIAHKLPVGMTGLLVASIFAAGMSTIATSITSSSTIVLTDYYQRFFNRKATDIQSMRVLYITNGVITVIGILVAFAFMSVESSLDAWWALSSIFGGGMLGLFLLGFVSQKVRNVDAAIATICGIGVVIWMSLSPLLFTEGSWKAFASPFHKNLAIVVGTTVVFCVGFLINKFLFKSKLNHTKSSLS